MTGTQYANLIASYLVKNYGARGLVVYREVNLGKSIIGKNRHVDVFLVETATQKAMAIECKYQGSAGTVDEKIPYAIEDLRAMHVPAFAVYAGDGFSAGVLHLLAGCDIAAHCLPSETLEPGPTTIELDHLVATVFGFWDVVLRKKTPFVG
jgi:hypothetical protein